MKACFGGARWPKAKMSKIAKNLRKTKVFGRFLEAKSFQKACKVAVWRCVCGFEGSKEATWMPCWLQDWLGRAKLRSRWPKIASREGQKRDGTH